VIVTAYCIDATFQELLSRKDEANSAELQNRLRDGKIDVAVDIDTGEVRPRHEAPAAGASKALLEKFRRCLGAENLQVLRDEWLRIRAEADERRWLSDDWSDIGPGDMVPWPNAFPGAPEMAFEYRGQRYVAIDSYCVTPGCACRDAMFTFVRAAEKQGSPGGTEVCALRIGTLRWRVRETHPLRTSEAEALELWKACQQAFPKLRHTVADRFKRMRRFGAVVFGPSEDLSKRAPVGGAAPVGRNDPCPCGSGKKYKKCCG
jgi:hypothetical protein